MSFLLGVLCVVLSAQASSLAQTPKNIQSAETLEVVWNTPQGPKTLMSWNSKDLEKSFKTISLQEKLPDEDRAAQWKGANLQDIVDKAIEGLPPEQKAQIDMLILRGSDGFVTMIPRSFITKYPLMVALKKSGLPLKTFQTVVPWNSRSKVQEEFLPLGNYFIPSLVRIEVANYRERYGALFLARRTDPSAMRGEKIFVQNCASCHALGRGPALGTLSKLPRVRTLATEGHPIVIGMPKISTRDHRALLNYLDAYSTENPAGMMVGLPSSASTKQ